MRWNILSNKGSIVPYGYLVLHVLLVGGAFLTSKFLREMGERSVLHAVIFWVVVLFVILFYFATHLQDPGYVSSDTVFFNSVRKRKTKKKESKGYRDISASFKDSTTETEISIELPPLKTKKSKKSSQKTTKPKSKPSTKKKAASKSEVSDAEKAAKSQRKGDVIIDIEKPKKSKGTKSEKSGKKKKISARKKASKDDSLQNRELNESRIQIPENEKEQAASRKELSADRDINESLAEIETNKKAVKTRKLPFKLKFCLICNLKQPLRVKHCKECKRCIASYDHHCPWLGTCIGERNHLFFFWYLFFQFIETLWIEIEIIKCFGDGVEDDNIIALPRAIIFCIGLFLFFMLGGLAIYHGYLATHMLTTWECYRWNSINYLKKWPEERGSPFTEGCLRNIRYFCCDSFKHLRRWRYPKTRKHSSK